MVWKVVLGLFCLTFLLLLIPVRYHFKLEMWKISVEIKALFGAFSKEIVIPGGGSDKAEEKRKQTEKNENIPGSERESITPAEEENKEINQEIKKPAEVEVKEKKSKEKPSVFKQIHFAIHNGLAEEIFKTVLSLFNHSKPRSWCIYGEFGTGDPMTTGLTEGMAHAFLPDITESVVWKYLEPSYKIKGKGRGRMIPLYAIYIILRLAVSQPARRFWRYRQGGMKDE